MKKFLFVFLIFTIQDITAQIDITSQELGIEGYFGASNQGGSFGIGPKFGFILNENIAIGPSFRIQRNWSNLLGNSFSQTVYGGGAFAHIRYKSKVKSTVFGAVEFEYLRSPFVDINFCNRLNGNVYRFGSACSKNNFLWDAV